MTKQLLMIVLFSFSIFQCAFSQAEEQLFPFDKPCLNYNEENFKVGEDLIKVMSKADFPQYCTLYSLSNYQVKEQWNHGYFIHGSKLNAQQTEATTVFLKSKVSYKANQALSGTLSATSKPNGQWAYFTGNERFALENGSEQELYTFQEIDF